MVSSAATTGSRKLRKKNPESGNQSYERNPKDKEPNCVHLCQLINQMVKEIRLAEEPQVWMSFVGHYLIISYRHQPHLQRKEGSMLVAEKKDMKRRVDLTRRTKEKNH